MKKILASDFDGTLFQKFKLTEKNRQAINRFRKENQFIIATGRNKQILDAACKKYRFEKDMLIATNGAWIETNDYTIKKTISNTLTDEVYGLLKNEVAHFSTFDENKRYTAFSHQNRKISFILWFIRSFLLQETLEKRYHNQDVLMIEIVGFDKENTAHARKIIEKNFSDIFEISGSSMYFDLTIKGANKCEALKEIQSYYQIKNEDMYSIGDSENDYEMLEHFNGFGIKKHKGIENHAKILVDTVDEAIEILLKEE
ncbi:MAG: HAD-IIB family hydrolase [Erysipelotrichaceae bacterium]